MYIIGEDIEKQRYYLLDTYCDVVDLGEWHTQIKDLHIDIPENGIIHLWSRYSIFRSVFRVSSCTFEAINQE